MTHALHGTRVLIVEDDFLSGLQLEEGLGRLGCVIVGPCATVEDGFDAASTNDDLDIAILDVQIRGGTSETIAAALDERDVPYVFLTGYRSPDLPGCVPREIVMMKPATVENVARHLARRLGR